MTWSGDVLPGRKVVGTSEIRAGSLGPKRRVMLGRYESVIAATYESAARAGEAGQGGATAGRR